MVVYLIIALCLLAVELLYFRIADKFNIIDKPNERSSHSSIVLRGGGVIFSLAMVAWVVMMVVQGEWSVVAGYMPFLVGLILSRAVPVRPSIRKISPPLSAWMRYPSPLLL